MDKVLESLEVIQANLLASLPSPIRPWSLANKLSRATRGVLVSGPRGVGKTTLLLWSAPKRSLYFSADNPLVSAQSLGEIVNNAFGSGFDGVIIDEVHHARDWAIQLKSLYDANPRRFIWASDSSSLVLRTGHADLSRRFPKLEIPLLSFREYLKLKHNQEFNPFKLWSISQTEIRPILDAVNVIAEFREHQSEGMRPFFLEKYYRAKLLATLEKSLFSDVPYFVPQIQESHIGLMNAIIGHLAMAPIPTINVDSLCREWEVGKEKLYSLLQTLEHIGILNIVGYQGPKKVGKGAKLLLADPSLYDCLGGNIGPAREAYVVTMLRTAGLRVFASKDETRGDFEVGKISIEVGGASKKPKKSDFVIRDDVEVPTAKVIPLWCLGFLY